MSVSLSRKERKALANEAKRNVKKLEDDTRKQKHLDMLNGMSVKLLETFINSQQMNLPVDFPVVARVDVPLWDCDALLADAQQLMNKFSSAVQYGGLHDGMWTTLCLRSVDGSTNNDGPSLTYKETPAWTESTYIVPHLLNQLKSTITASNNIDDATPTASFFQRVRLSIIPPNCNVGWHVDYENTQRDGPIRMHIPIQRSDGFMLNIGGTDCPMREGETWLGQFELPHRLSNQKDGCVRIHLVVDMFPLPQQQQKEQQQQHLGPVECVDVIDSVYVEAVVDVDKEMAKELVVAAPIVVLVADVGRVTVVEDDTVAGVVVDAVVIPSECCVNITLPLLIPVVHTPVVPVLAVVVVAVVPAEPLSEEILVLRLSEVASLPLAIAGTALSEVASLPPQYNGVTQKDEKKVNQAGVQQQPLDWEPIRQTVFGRAIHEAFESLYRPYVTGAVSQSQDNNEDSTAANVSEDDSCSGSNINSSFNSEKSSGNVISCTSSDGQHQQRLYTVQVEDVIAQSVAAFSAYRWGGPFANTTEARAAVEASYYLK